MKKILTNYDKYKYFFRVQMNAIDYAKLFPAILRHLGKNDGLKKAYIIVEDANWSVAIAGFVKKWLEGNKWEVVGYDKFPIGATDYSTSLFKSKKKKAEVIIIAFSNPQASILMKQWYAMKVPALPVGLLGVIGERSWKVYRGNLEWTVHLVPSIGHIPAKKWPKSVRFYNAFTKRWGKSVESGNAVPNTYDAVYVVADAIQRADSLDSDKLIKALEQTDIEGAIGRIRFGKDHKVVYGNNPKEAAVGFAFQWRANGKRVVVYPELIADGKVVLPSWMKKK